MVTKVVSCNPTHRESHSSFYEGYHGDYDFSHLSVKCYSFQRTVSQGYLLGMWYFSLNTSIKARLSTKYLNLPISNKQKRENTKNDNWVMMNERPMRLSEEIRENLKKLELTRTKSEGDLWNPWKDSWNFLNKLDGWFDNLYEFECLSALEILNNCEVKKRQLSYKALYRGQEMSGIYPA